MLLFSCHSSCTACATLLRLGWSSQDGGCQRRMYAHVTSHCVPGPARVASIRAYLDPSAQPWMHAARNRRTHGVGAITRRRRHAAGRARVPPAMRRVRGRPPAEVPERVGVEVMFRVCIDRILFQARVSAHIACCVCRRQAAQKNEKNWGYLYTHPSSPIIWRAARAEPASRS